MVCLWYFHVGCRATNHVRQKLLLGKEGLTVTTDWYLKLKMAHAWSLTAKSDSELKNKFNYHYKTLKMAQAPFTWNQITYVSDSLSYQIGVFTWPHMNQIHTIPENQYSSLCKHSLSGVFSSSDSQKWSGIKNNLISCPCIINNLILWNQALFAMSHVC